MYTLNKRRRILYTNWKGKTSVREITPVSLFYGVCEIHGREEDYYLTAFCHEKGAERTFKMSDIHWWGKIDE